jgi:hypothetical protein
VNDGLPLIEPLIGLKECPCMLNVRIPTRTMRANPEGIAQNTNRTIVEAINQAHEMLEKVMGQVEASLFGGPM